MTTTLRVHYDPYNEKATAVSDGWAKSKAKQIAEAYALTPDGKTFTVPESFSTFSVIDQLRLMRAQGKVAGKVFVVYGGEEIEMCECGRLASWPQGLDMNMEFLEALFDAQEENGYGCH